MKYQLVLQFAAASTEDFDRLVALEDTLIGELDDLATVDGHDFGLGEFNIFILTDDPAESFDKAHRALAVSGELLRGSPIPPVIALRSCESGLSLTFGTHPVAVKRWQREACSE